MGGKGIVEYVDDEEITKEDVGLFKRFLSIFKSGASQKDEELFLCAKSKEEIMTRKEVEELIKEQIKSTQKEEDKEEQLSKEDIVELVASEITKINNQDEPNKVNKKIEILEKELKALKKQRGLSNQLLTTTNQQSAIKKERKNFQGIQI